MDTLKETFFEVLGSMMPLTVAIIVLQFTMISMPTDLFIQFILGAVMATVGIYLFLLGVQVGLSPVGEMIGSALSKTRNIYLIVIFGFLLGFVVTVAEPGVQVLSQQVDIVSDGDVSSFILILFVSIGVGFSVAFALLRIVFNISLLLLLSIGYTIIFILALWAPANFVPISLDAGGATTGAMAVPFILALGVGLTSVLRGKASSGDSFGLIALASIGPVISVLLLGVMYG
ncbi:Protein of unknown function [Pelagirhabdus alkalitolerans]|uniref:DUF1538 domain-containing protein n=1 Tax=Pelagirhabdus alkalitolerans TaxID=1612202 RepID=A0A1G6L097_9BACI|nr:DUF1538 domain-containing protein [Pelagirhabdus alkalitolerans]SDC36772.1 Protein of unknown function [Pelagirhabdus alkalitolerans]